MTAQEFISDVKPALEKQDWCALTKLLKQKWSVDDILSLLHSDNADARKVAALAIGLIGQSCALPELSRKLRDTDRMVVEMAEHAMWQIWFREGCDEANKHLALGAEALNQQDVTSAITYLNRAIELCPKFAEAYNQRAIAYYLSEQYESSINDCLIVIEQMPLHFGAWSGLGHCYLAMEKLPDALAAYEKAVQINPHLECIVELIQELRGKVL